VRRTFQKYPGLNGEEFVAFHIGERMTVIGGTWYGGEMKKGIFTMMNYFLPLKGVGAFHCSANEGKPGTRRCSSACPAREDDAVDRPQSCKLIGDDEHGWDNEGIFNFEGGCYAKCINLSPEKRTGDYAAIRRDALLENVVVR
jgi:phosphoenolpyruvate carboxykinase (ATP)